MSNTQDCLKIAIDVIHDHDFKRYVDHNYALAVRMPGLHTNQGDYTRVLSVLVQYLQDFFMR